MQASCCPQECKRQPFWGDLQRCASVKLFVFRGRHIYVLGLVPFRHYGERTVWITVDNIFLPAARGPHRTRLADATLHALLPPSEKEVQTSYIRWNNQTADISTSRARRMYRAGVMVTAFQSSSEDREGYFPPFVRVGVGCFIAWEELTDHWCITQSSRCPQ